VRAIAAESKDDERRAELVAAAKAGDQQAFHRLAKPHLRELHVHCYRMLGSVHDAEDALQETLVRAWRHLDGFDSRRPFRAWIYRIATNACLTAAERKRREPQAAAGHGFEIEPPPPNALDVELADVGPYPDAALDELGTNPAACYDLHESVQLAFLAAIQLLPPRQRATLLLRDVLGWSAAETAELLESTVASANSALQRARATLERKRAAGQLRLDRQAPPDAVQRDLLRRFVDAWEAVDISGLVGLLRDDALLTMPPLPLSYRGRSAIGEFFGTVPEGGALDRIRLVPTRANRQPALAAYVRAGEGAAYEPYGIMVLNLDGASIAEITGFGDPALFAHFGLPERLEG
jgi:RNA polymerase sigma-70 factor (TIGR02960 family)